MNIPGMMTSAERIETMARLTQRARVSNLGQGFGILAQMRDRFGDAAMNKTAEGREVLTLMDAWRNGTLSQEGMARMNELTRKQNIYAMGERLGLQPVEVSNMYKNVRGNLMAAEEAGFGNAASQARVRGLAVTQNMVRELTGTFTRQRLEAIGVRGPEQMGAFIQQLMSTGGAPEQIRAAIRERVVAGARQRGVTLTEDAINTQTAAIMGGVMDAADRSGVREIGGRAGLAGAAGIAGDRAATEATAAGREAEMRKRIADSFRERIPEKRRGFVGQIITGLLESLADDKKTTAAVLMSKMLGAGVDTREVEALRKELGVDISKTE